MIANVIHIKFIENLSCFRTSNMYNNSCDIFENAMETMKIKYGKTIEKQRRKAIGP